MDEGRPRDSEEDGGDQDAAAEPEAQAHQDGPGDGRTVVVDAGKDAIRVQDDGPGVAPDQRDRIFEPGVSTTDGEGMGLPIVARIAAAHGWAVDVTDGRLGGARFDLSGVTFVQDDEAP